MAKLPIRHYDDLVLRKRALPIESITNEIEQLAHDMIETMIHANGIGLAGPQIGVLLRIFVIREEKVDAGGQYYTGEPEVIINPTLSKPSDEKVSMLEGCLSLPGLYIEVFRPKEINIRYQNLKGEWVEERLIDFRGRMMMHENDHLNGVLTIDRMDKRERKKIEPQLQMMDKKYHPNK